MKTNTQPEKERAAIPDTAIASNNPFQLLAQTSQRYTPFPTGTALQRKKTDVMQFDFRDNAIAKINGRAKGNAERDEDPTNLSKMTVCGTSANFIYDAVSEGQVAAGAGAGIGTLTAAITDAEKRIGQVFIFFVDADIVGHFFTILQNGTQATIIQGYLDKISVAQNIAAEGGGRQIWNTAALKSDLALLVQARDKIKDIMDWRDADEPGLVELGAIHTRLFGPGNDAEERLWIKRNIIRKRADDLSWKASFAEGAGAALNSTPAAKKKGKCFLTTACTQYMGLPDDCEELTVLRAFRDEYMSQLEGGDVLLAGYYAMAPAIVTAIQEKPAAEAALIWHAMYQTIRSCVEAIKNGDKHYALTTYRSQVMRLEDEFIKRRRHMD